MTRFRNRHLTCSATLVVVGFFLFSAIARAQLVAELTTDKATYDYGESIVVTLKLSNPTSEVIEFKYSCDPFLTFDDFRFPEWCPLWERFHYYGPGSWRSWTYEIKPDEYGLPTYSGQHSIIASYYAFADTLVVTGPIYIGGRISIEFESGMLSDDVETIRASLNGVVLDSDVLLNGNLREVWQIIGISIEDAIAQYEGHDSVIRVFHSYPFLDYFTVDVDHPFSVPHQFELSQNYPNPFNPQTTISYTLARTGHVELKVENVLGELITTLEDGVKPTGEHTTMFNATSLPSGVYFYTLTAGDYSQTRKMVLLR